MNDWIKWAIGIAYAAGVGVAGYAIAQEARITALEVNAEQSEKAVEDLEETTDKLTDVLVELNMNVRLLSNELKHDREDREEE